MQSEINHINKMSAHLFWDVNISEINVHKNEKFIIKKVLQFGLYSDWKLLLDLYGINKIATIATQIKDIDKRTASFLSVMGNIPKHKFQCYSTKPSIPQHWNF